MLKIAGIEPFSIVDGPGFRYTIFFQGCPHCCDGCHNPATWDINGGREESVCNIIEDLKKQKNLHGVTISGGEPFLQYDQLLKLLMAIKKLNYHVIVFTGYTFEELLKKDSKALLYIDVLIDGKYIEERRSLDLRFRGSTNQRVIDVPSSLLKNEVTIINWDA